MATIHFYEKPGCVNNARQKHLLTKAGHTLVVYDLLQQAWREDQQKLRSFFGDMPVAEWFNRSAPDIKNGHLIPDAVDAGQAIQLMISNPLLIRRPLLEIEGHRAAGFDPATIASLLGMTGNPLAIDLETCPNTQSDKSACLP
jgi:nitrogenase-associated protein